MVDAEGIQPPLPGCWPGVQHYTRRRKKRDEPRPTSKSVCALTRGGCAPARGGKLSDPWHLPGRSGATRGSRTRCPPYTKREFTPMNLRGKVVPSLGRAPSSPRYECGTSLSTLRGHCLAGRGPGGRTRADAFKARRAPATPAPNGTGGGICTHNLLLPTQACCSTHSARKRRRTGRWRDQRESHPYFSVGNAASYYTDPGLMIRSPTDQTGGRRKWYERRDLHPQPPAPHAGVLLYALRP
jgi:hypothetical protein